MAVTLLLDEVAELGQVVQLQGSGLPAAPAATLPLCGPRPPKLHTQMSLGSAAGLRTGYTRANAAPTADYVVPQGRLAAVCVSY